MNHSSGASPNVLLITTDQQRFDHLGVKGLTAIDTPNLDRMAREGVHFDRAYCPAPICTPARVSLLTGRYPSSHGAYSIGVTADPLPRPTVADLLGAAGYATALFGKTHFVRRADEASHVAGQPNPPPGFFREFSGPYMGFQHVQVSSGHTIEANPDMHYRVFLEDRGADYSEWYPNAPRPGRKCSGGWAEDYDHWYSGPWNIPPELHDTAWVGGLTERYVRGAKGGRPWFCWASFQDPHNPFACPEPWFSRVRTDRMQLPEGPRAGEFDDKPAFYKAAAAKELGEGWQALDDGHGVPCSFHLDRYDREAGRAMQATLGMIAFLDDRIGAILRALEETGQADNTLVVFTTDHGEMHGHHGFWGKGLTAYDDCQRIPLLAWGPGLIRPVGSTQALANLVDLPRTFLALAGVAPPVGMQGVDLAPVLRGQSQSVQDWTMVECRVTERTIYQTTFITGRYKLIVYRDSDLGELYDMAADPDQYANLWNSAPHQPLRAELLLRFAQATMRKEGQVNPRVAFA
jgi:arylsulfatase A-like enzyme